MNLPYKDFFRKKETLRKKEMKKIKEFMNQVRERLGESKDKIKPKSELVKDHESHKLGR
eukprot:CAMPEP_0114590114 /NCGR_PEP_ID=MMETSP0125-20121206/12424_1 /TAXON_ID=485358 ORGANISM="Aristerostoma sp., Strain ATCC 50986" /NCGR_SAMPLE_ID=MMETSP0125 /ASSEMBLY_ACC=CAM_ASM_000245 /LENGTH=58 /DNA_ID=CAMNT_0001787401 /DNA_START=878 /DNA_END=1054 /DNA_ORIENTATION=-